jgi:sugar/nucleoside kinase (ribokinase family)
MSDQKPVVCLGILVADMVGRPVRSIPDAGRLALVDQMSLYAGGCAINTATALARLGLPVEVIGKVGKDALGDFLIHMLMERGVGSSGVRRDALVGTSSTMIMVDPQGERRYIHFIGANARLTPEDIDLALVEDASILHIAGALVMPGIDGGPTAELLQKAQSAGVMTFMDTVWDDTGRWSRLEPCLPYLDAFVPTLEEAQAVTGLDDPRDVGHKLLDSGVKTAALKMAAQGCLVVDRSGKEIRLPAFEVKVVDTTGAGDAFAAGFIAGMWHGWELEQTAKFANAVAALCVTGMGAAGGLRSLDESVAFMNSASVRNPRP